jgi:cytochrome P450
MVDIAAEKPIVVKPPKVRGLPILGSALNMRKNPLAYFLSLYERHGPVFEIKLLNQTYIVMAGIEANKFLAREGDEYLGSDVLFGSFAEELGSNALLTAMDGPPHKHQRRIQRHGYSKEVILDKIQDVMGITEGFTSTWMPNDIVPVFPTIQRIVTEQLGILVLGRTCGDYFDDLWLLLNTNMNVNVMRLHPRRLLKSPRYLKAKARGTALARDVLEWHRANPPVDRSPNLVDDLVSAVNENGEPYTDEVIMTTILGAYFAGMDTVASTASFMLYAILKTPGLLERLTTEIDAMFAKGPLTAESLREMHVLHNTAMETLRYYPIAAFTPRIVSKPFVFSGFNFEPGTQVFVANALTHFLPEYFSAPETFDIDRYDSPDYKKVPQALAPYTLGAHTCLGAGMAEIQLMLLIASILRNVSLQLYPSDYQVEVYASPIPNPGRKFSVRVVGQRS